MQANASMTNVAFEVNFETAQSANKGYQVGRKGALKDSLTQHLRKYILCETFSVKSLISTYEEAQFVVTVEVAGCIRTEGVYEGSEYQGFRVVRRSNTGCKTI